MLQKFALRLMAEKARRDEEGQSMAEYGLILAGIAVVVMAVVFTLGGEIRGTFNSVVNQLP